MRGKGLTIGWPLFRFCAFGPQTKTPPSIENGASSDGLGSALVPRCLHRNFILQPQFLPLERVEFDVIWRGSRFLHGNLVFQVGMFSFEGVQMCISHSFLL